MWEYEKRHNILPDGSTGQTEEVQSIAKDLWVQLGINEKGVKAMDEETITYVLPPPLINNLKIKSTFPLNNGVYN
jgi:hypothetical protein